MCSSHNSSSISLSKFKFSNRKAMISSGITLPLRSYISGCISEISFLCLCSLYNHPIIPPTKRKSTDIRVPRVRASVNTLPLVLDLFSFSFTSPSSSFLFVSLSVLQDYIEVIFNLSCFWFSKMTISLS